MTTTYMFDKSTRKNLMIIQRQSISIIQSFFSSPSPFLRVEDFPKSSTQQALISRTTVPSYEASGGPGGGLEQVLLGRPLFTVTPNKVKIQLFYLGAPNDSSARLSDAQQVGRLGNALTHC